MIAVAMNSFELSGVMFTPLHAVTMSYIGRKNAILIGMLILMLTNTAMGLLSMSSDWKWFFSLSIVIRFIEGYGDTLAMTAFFSVICSKFPTQKTRYIGYLESSIGLGLMAGPPIASLIYGRFGYALAFYFFTIAVGINQIG